MLDDRDLGELVGYEKQMRKNGSILAVEPMKNFDRQFDFNPARHIKKCSGRNQRLVQRGELGRAKNSRLGHEMFPEKIDMFDHRALERLKDDPAFLQLLGNDVTFDQSIAGENQSGGDFIESARLLKNRVANIITLSSTKLKRRKIEKIDIGKSPELIFARRRRKRLELLPRFTLLLAKPIREIAQSSGAGQNRSGLTYFIMGC